MTGWTGQRIDGLRGAGPGPLREQRHRDEDNGCLGGFKTTARRCTVSSAACFIASREALKGQAVSGYRRGGRGTSEWGDLGASIGGDDVFFTDIAGMRGGHFSFQSLCHFRSLCRCTRRTSPSRVGNWCRGSDSERDHAWPVRRLSNVDHEPTRCKSPERRHRAGPCQQQASMVMEAASRSSLATATRNRVMDTTLCSSI